MISLRSSRMRASTFPRWWKSLSSAAMPARANQADPGFDAAAFVTTYAALAAQRATKILGIFARLNRRDGKPQYLRHMPRVWAYLQRSLEHPALAPLKAWYGVNVPALRTDDREADPCLTHAAI